jgi:hypothetical protein
MEADQPQPQFGDSSGMLCSSEARRYLELLMEHEEPGPCVHSSCPECRLLAKICQLIQSEVFRVNEYPVSICVRNATVAEMAPNEATPAATQRTSRGFLHSSVCATVVAAARSMASKASAPQPLPETLPFEERVRRRAYELYLRRGGQSGSELDDWLQAEQEILTAQEQ